ncbi:glycoside hydrolase family 71/99-like protein [Chryseobacterium sp.]|uniref:glycoside hydrolase family 71/99-like protein n=1 Tax=Chryseobacterium sp. TaxID=1871047 RepID=UPI00388DDB9C
MDSIVIKFKIIQTTVALITVISICCSSCSQENIPEEIDSEHTNSSLHLKTVNEGFSPTDYGDVVGKVVVGYQGWFNTDTDKSPLKKWRHWSTGNAPKALNQTFELWPDVSEYSTTYETDYDTLGNGQPSKLYSSNDANVIDKHVEWMRKYGIDCIALQRFGTELNDPVRKLNRDQVTQKVRNAAQSTTIGDMYRNRPTKFYIMYDISGWANFQSEIKEDWLNTIVNKLDLLSSPAYAKQQGRYVVCIWGMGVNGRPGNSESYRDVIKWFQDRGCYVIAGTKKHWRTDPNINNAMLTANMITPWTVGSYDSNQVDGYANLLFNDKAVCDLHGVDFQPVVFPGFAWSNWNGGQRNQIARQHGDFLWKQFYNIKRIGIPNVYVAMFDEYDEGTAIAKAATHQNQIPSNQYFLTLDADSTKVSSDFYLRLTGDGARLIKGQIPLQQSHPTPHQ